MRNTAPHYLLFSETQTNPDHLAGRWRFVLEELHGPGRIEAADLEPGVRGERLQLLAAVRGLEALEQPSRVTLITPSRYVGRGIRNNLTVWRDNDWQWERFGEMTRIKNADLWRRVDRAARIHQIDCRIWNFGRLFQTTPVTRFDPVTEPRWSNRSGDFVDPRRGLGHAIQSTNPGIEPVCGCA